MKGIEAYPLHWPPGWPRTRFRRSGNFSFGRQHRGTLYGAAMGAALDNLLLELSRLGVADVIVSSNHPLRKDGLPYANPTPPADPGVAAYFKMKGEHRCIPCDKWDRVADNVHAIGLTVAALRGLERWGAKHMVEAAFRGFKALPAGPQWWQLLGLSSDHASEDEIRRAYKQAARAAHPDRGGSHEKMVAVQQAMEAGLELIGGRA